MATLTKTLRFDDEVQNVFRNMVWTDEGKTGDITWQLDPSIYKKVKKAIEAVGGSWDKRTKVHRFTDDPRPQILGLIQKGTLTVERDGFFPTPQVVVLQLLSLVPLAHADNAVYLEPSAGDGGIVMVLLDEGVAPERLYCIEKNSKRCEILRKMVVYVACGDFMRYKNSLGLRFARIFMNPPFEAGQDGEHIMRAYQLLDRGGKMAAIAGEGIFSRSDRKADAFQKWMKLVGAYTEKLPDHSFRESGTDVNTRMLIVEK